MTILKQLQTDMRKLQMDYQRKLVVEALRSRVQELTLGDIRKILNSPLGADLGDLRLAALFGPAAGAATTAEATRPTRASRPRVEAKQRGATPPDKTTSKRSSRKRKTTGKVGRVGQKTVDAVWEILAASERPVTCSEIASKLELHPSTVTSALKRLRDAKRIEKSGASRLTRYAVRSTTGPRIEPLLKPEIPATATAPAAAQSPATAGTRTQADFDAAVLAEVGRQGPASSTVIHTAVGGKLDEVRASLKRLVDAGRVTRSGERRFTRYTLK